MPRTVTRPAEVTVPAEGESSATRTSLGAVAIGCGVSAAVVPHPVLASASAGIATTAPAAALNVRRLRGSKDCCGCWRIVVPLWESFAVRAASIRGRPRRHGPQG